MDLQGFGVDLCGERPGQTRSDEFSRILGSFRWISSDLVGFSRTKHQHLWASVAKLPPAVQNPELNTSLAEHAGICADFECIRSYLTVFVRTSLYSVVLDRVRSCSACLPPKPH